MPAAGELVVTDDCYLSIGGCASNVAVDLAKMQVPTVVAGCVGDDLFGRFACEQLEDRGAETTYVQRLQGVPTSQTLIVNVRGQDRRFIHLFGANSRFRGEHFPRDVVRQAKILYVGGYFLMESLSPGDLIEVFREARDAGVRTVLDVVIPGPGDYLSTLRQVLPFTDVFLPNRDEAEVMTGVADPVKQAELLAGMGAATVVITCGGAGAVLVDKGLRLRSGVFDVPFVDGTGGGDAFDAGFICGLLENAGPEQCLLLGSALGASCVRQSTATEGVFRREEVDDFLASHSLSIEPL